MDTTLLQMQQSAKYVVKEHIVSLAPRNVVTVLQEHGVLYMEHNLINVLAAHKDYTKTLRDNWHVKIVQRIHIIT